MDEYNDYNEYKVKVTGYVTVYATNEHEAIEEASDEVICLEEPSFEIER